MFFEVLSAINDPNKQASIGQLDQLTQALQQLSSNQGMNANQMQLMMTVLGGALQPMLKQQCSQLGNEQLASMLNGTTKISTLTSIFSPQQQQQLVQVVAQKTGMQASIAQSMVPQLLPIIMDLLNMGGGTPGSISSENALFNSFLDGNRPGDTDLGSVFKFASRFLNAPNLKD